MPGFPTRPATLPSDDADLIEQVLDAKRTSRRSDAVLLRRFGEWRGAVLRAENKAVGSLLTLLAAHRSLVQHGDHEHAVELARWIGTEYDVAADADRSLADCQALAERACRRRDVMSDAVLLEEPVQAWMPADGDNREAEQEDFSWDGNI